MSSWRRSASVVRPFSNCAWTFAAGLLVAGDDLGLVRRGEDVAERHRHTGARGPVEAGVLDAVERRGDLHLGVLLGELVHDLRQLALVGLLAHERVALGERVVEQRLAERGVQQTVALSYASFDVASAFALEERETGNADAHLGLQVERALVLGHDRLGRPSRTRGPRRPRPP